MNKEKLKQLQESLPFLHREELRLLCERHALSIRGSKPQVLQRILYFVETGKEREEKKIPSVLRIQKGAAPSLHLQSLMLYGGYKNDLKTRLFFKKIIGEYFHFTAFGIDWLRQRWLAGQPPTYQEFAQMWESEFKKGQQQKPAPKKEWAYICFTQQFLKMNPKATRQELLAAWHQERERHKKMIFGLL
ncbi:MAG: hypothetical protein FJ390_06035 [Verrucomicrobia bacterium]|nr:hypothetical protein [Verrucomicrobiota bacterium]